MDMKDVTIGTKSFYRPEKIRKCLESIYNADLEIKKVIVADDGDITEEKQKIYDNYKQKLPLKVLDLEYDYGLGGSRNRVFEELESEYVLWIDDDMIVPRNVNILKQILVSRPEIGGVAGMLIEEGSFRAATHDLEIKEGIFGRTLVRKVNEVNKDHIETEIGEKTIFYFDFVPNCLMLRKECLEDAKWDDNYIIMNEHKDFFLTHKQETDWKFAFTKEVIFNHYPGGSIDFKEERNDDNKHKDSHQYFKEKWGIKRTAFVSKYIEDERGLGRELKDFLKRKMPVEVLGELQERDILPLRKREDAKVEENE